MTLSAISLRRGLSGVFVGCMLGGVAAATVALPTASAAPCTASSATATISQVSGAASAYLAAHPGADEVLSNAASNTGQAQKDAVRSYFIGHMGEYFDLKNITAPLTDLQRNCNAGSSPTDLIAAFNEFQNGGF